jgi:hypothetical protein
MSQENVRRLFLKNNARRRIMNRTRQHLPSPATAIAIAALIVASGGAAFAAIPDPDGAVQACYQKSNGNLRVVESSSRCRNSENAVALSGAGQSAQGRVYTNSVSAPYGAFATVVDVPGFVRETKKCEPLPNDGSQLVTRLTTTTENLQVAGDLHVTFAEQTLLAGASHTFVANAHRNPGDQVVDSELTFFEGAGGRLFNGWMSGRVTEDGCTWAVGGVVKT